MRHKVLLLEGIHPVAVETMEKSGCEVKRELSAYSDSELVERLDQYDAVGIRSKTQLTKNILEKLTNLKTIGCFCIGTNQVHLETSGVRGIPVFNAPYSNTRSVAELVIAQMISLSRQICDRSAKAHQGVWDKSASGSNEVRGKILGIIGYGHIGSQVSILAESLGLKVQFHDVLKKLPLGNARHGRDFETVLSTSDFVSLHVPATKETENMITSTQLKHMKKGSYLINASRGSVVNIPDLVEALKSEHIAGAAIDVYPKEPKNNQEAFSSDLQGLKNVILTPHIGGSTEEAQFNIGKEVSNYLLGYLNLGQTAGSVNFPQINVGPLVPGHSRLLNIHENTPGVLSGINSIVSEMGANIARQSLATNKDIGYLALDLSLQAPQDLKDKVIKMSTSIKTRMLG